MSDERPPHAATEYLEALLALRATGAVPTPHEWAQSAVTLTGIDALLKMKDAAARNLREAEQAQLAYEKAFNSQALRLWPAMEAEMRARQEARPSA
jgi:hypothetical protein